MDRPISLTRTIHQPFTTKVPSQQEISLSHHQQKGTFDSYTTSMKSWKVKMLILIKRWTWSDISGEQGKKVSKSTAVKSYQSFSRLLLLLPLLEEEEEEEEKLQWSVDNCGGVKYRLIWMALHHEFMIEAGVLNFVSKVYRKTSCH